MRDFEAFIEAPGAGDLPVGDVFKQEMYEELEEEVSEGQC